MQGDYYIPCLTLPAEKEKHIGVWGQRHRRYLQEHKRAIYTTLLTSGKLNEYLADIDGQAEEIFFRLVQQIAEVNEKDRTYYEFYSLPRTEEIREGYKEISFVCLRPDGAYESPSMVGIMCRTASKKVEGLENFHFHMLRHTFTSNLLSNGAAPKDVQVSTTMNIYAHATREAKRTSARLLDKVGGGE